MNKNNESKISDMNGNSILKIKQITVDNKSLVYTLYNVEKETDTFLEINMIDNMVGIEMATRLNDFLSGEFPKGWGPSEMVKRGINDVIDDLQNKKDNPTWSLELFKDFGNWATNDDVGGKGHRCQSPIASEIMRQILGFKITEEDIGPKTKGKPNYHTGYEIFHNISNKIHDRQLKSPAPFPPRVSTGTAPTAASLCRAG